MKVKTKLDQQRTRKETYELLFQKHSNLIEVLTKNVFN